MWLVALIELEALLVRSALRIPSWPGGPQLELGSEHVARQIGLRENWRLPMRVLVKLQLGHWLLLGASFYFQASEAAHQARGQGCVKHVP